MAESKTNLVRAKQFSLREIDVLKNMMEFKYNELNAKHKNGKKHCDRIWAEITDAVNAVGVCRRTVLQTKEKWRNMMKKAKADFSAEQISLGKTGGGPAIPPMSQTSSDIVMFMRDLASFSGIPGAAELDTAPEFESNEMDTGEIKDDSTSAYDLWTVDESDQTRPTSPSSPQASTSTSETRHPGKSIVIEKEGKRTTQSKTKTIKELQTEYYIQAIKNQKVQTERFEKLSKLTDLIIQGMSPDS